MSRRARTCRLCGERISWAVSFRGRFMPIEYVKGQDTRDLPPVFDRKKHVAHRCAEGHRVQGDRKPRVRRDDGCRHLIESAKIVRRSARGATMIRAYGGKRRIKCEFWLPPSVYPPCPHTFGVLLNDKDYETAQLAIQQIVEAREEEKRLA